MMPRFSSLPFLVVFVCFLLSNGTGNAQDTIAKANPEKKFSGINQVLKSNPLPVLWGPIPYTSEYRVNCEFITSHHQSLEIGLSYLGKNIFLWAIEDSLNNNQGKFLIHGFRFQAEYRFFPKPFSSAPDGIYLGPHLSYSDAYFTLDQLVLKREYSEITHFNINLKMGYEQILSDRLTFDFFIGLGYKINRWYDLTGGKKVQVPITDMGYFYTEPAKVILGFNLGWIL